MISFLTSVHCTVPRAILRGSILLSSRKHRILTRVLTTCTYYVGASTDLSKGLESRYCIHCCPMAHTMKTAIIFLFFQLGTSIHAEDLLKGKIS